MLRELFELVKGSAENNIVNNPDIPNEQNDAVIAEATNTVASGLRNVVAGGGVQNLLSLFGNNAGTEKGGLLSNPIVNMMVGHLAGKLITKYNLGGEQANQVANNLIPDILGNLINKTNDSGNSQFSLENLLRSITGNKNDENNQDGNSGFSIPDILNQLGGGQTSGNSGGGLMDLVTKLARGAQSQQQKNGAGGLMDIIGGFFK